MVTDPKLFVGELGLFHAVWTTFLEDGSAGPGYYASFDPQTISWSEPMELDTPGIRTPSVIETQGKILSLIITRMSMETGGEYRAMGVKHGMCLT